MKRVNKKGQQMTLGTIIAIVLGIAVLVFLIFGFSTGWSNMWSKITQLGGGGANVDDVVRGCEVACAQNSVDAFCRQERSVNYGDGKWDKGSCQTFIKEKDKVVVNIKSCSISCPEGSVPELETSEEGEEESTGKCGDLEPVGVWVVDAAACSSPKRIRTDEVQDNSDKGVNTVCCSD